MTTRNPRNKVSWDLPKYFDFHKYFTKKLYKNYCKFNTKIFSLCNLVFIFHSKLDQFEEEYFTKVTILIRSLSQSQKKSFVDDKDLNPSSDSPNLTPSHTLQVHRIDLNFSVFTHIKFHYIYVVQYCIVLKYPFG